MTLGNRVPGRFETFLHQKREDGERYRLWRLDYRRRAGLLEHPERALPEQTKPAPQTPNLQGIFLTRKAETGIQRGMHFRPA